MKKKLLSFLNKMHDDFCLKYFIKSLVLLFFSCFLLSLSSCATLKNVAKKGNPLKLHLYPALKIPLLETSKFKGENIEKKFNLIIERKKTKKSYTALLAANKEEIEIIIFNEQNERISDILYKENSLVESFCTEKWALSPEQILSVFQCAFYDVNDVAQILNSIKLKLTVENLEADAEENRRIYNKRNCIIKMTKKAGYIRCRNYEKKFILYLTEI